MDWQDIETAPTDGRLVRLKRVWEGQTISDGVGRFGVIASDAPARAPLEPDLLGRLNAGDYTREAQANLKWLEAGHWLTEDCMYAFPTPTHWMPLP